MRQLIRAGLMVAVVATPRNGQAETTAQRMTRWQPLIAEAGQRFGIPQAWVEAVMLAESGGRASLNGQPITSPAGALGLMQVMPDTYAELRRSHGLGADPQAPRDNILAGTAYLRAMFDRFGYPGLFAAYHAGPGRYGRYLATGEALPTETMAYLATLETLSRSSVKSMAQTAPTAQRKPVTLAAGDGLFFIRNGVAAGGVQVTPFVTLRNAPR